jgi:hypothetical protein
MRAPDHDPVEIADGVWLNLSPLDLPDDFPNPDPYRYRWELTGTPEVTGRTTYFPLPPSVSAIIEAGGGSQFHHAPSVEDAIVAAHELYWRSQNAT